MLPFHLQFRSGIPAYEQVVYSVKKAIISGGMKPGDSFPSVRVLSQELRINPNTAHKVVTQLINEGLIEVRPGTGTVVAAPGASTAAERSNLLKRELEQLVVEAKKLGLSLDAVQDAVGKHWQRLGGPTEK